MSVVHFPSAGFVARKDGRKSGQGVVTFHPELDAQILSVPWYL